MGKQTRVSKLYSFLPTEVDGFDSLAELALDMRWSWSHYGDKVWKPLKYCGRPCNVTRKFLNKVKDDTA